MKIAVGDRMPNGSFGIMRAGQPESLSAQGLFEGKKVVLVSVPGAFTPTCSMHHLPGLVRQAAQILQKGVDTIACMAVNDVYVMDAWARHLGAGEQILMLADGNAEYTRALGLELDAKALGLGIRGQRFVIVAEDAVVTHLAVEEPACFDVTKAEAILKLL
jgi:peroxiredoxin (alkyl hydroperoxide reductase subunit C)